MTTMAPTSAMASATTSLTKTHHHQHDDVPPPRLLPHPDNNNHSAMASGVIVLLAFGVVITSNKLIYRSRALNVVDDADANDDYSSCISNYLYVWSELSAWSAWSARVCEGLTQTFVSPCLFQSKSDGIRHRADASDMSDVRRRTFANFLPVVFFILISEQRHVCKTLCKFEIFHRAFATPTVISELAKYWMQ